MADAQFEDEILATLGQVMPYCILAYVLSLATLRLSFSPFLEIDEAEFVGLVDWRWIYANSHPPLFNWLTRIGLELTGWNWPLSVSLVKYGALAIYYLSIWFLTVRLGGATAATLAIAAAAFLPQIIWMSATTMAHTTLAMACAAATAWALHRALSSAAGARAWIWFAAFGLFAAGGMLSKYTFGLFLGPLLAVMLTDAVLRRRFLRLPLLSGAVLFLALVVPMVMAALDDPAASASRIDRLYHSDGWVASLDPEHLGVDGLIALIGGLLAWAAPLAAIWTAALWFDGARGAKRATGDVLAERFTVALGRMFAIGLALCALLILIADVQRVHTRYLTPLLCVLPVWLALRWPLGRSATTICALACFVYLLVLPGFWAQVTFSGHRFAIPYDELGSAIARETGGKPVPIVANRHDDAANAIIALGWPGARSPDTLRASDPDEDNTIVLLWRGHSAPPDHLPPDNSRSVAPIRTIALRHRDAFGEEIEYSFQRFETRQAK